MNKLYFVLLVVVLLLGIALYDFVHIKFGGTTVAVPDIPRQPYTVGSGSPLTLIVLGDSTSVGQGGTYETGIARGMADALAQQHTVTMHNFGVSGARARTVLKDQLPQVAQHRPDVVVIAVGANDVTHLTPVNDVRKSMVDVVSQLRAQNPRVVIMLTGSPAMGSVPRLPQPLRWAAGWQTERINAMFDEVALQYSLHRAPLAEKTGPIFARDASLFAADNFHPNTRGYDIWVPVLTETLREAVGQK